MPERIWIAMTSENLDDDVAKQFARAPFFAEWTIEDDEMRACEIHRNPYVDANHAGPQAAEWIARTAPMAVIAGQFGCRALDVLVETRAEIVERSGMSVRQAVASYLKDEVTAITSDRESARPFRRGGRRRRRQCQRRRTA